MAVRIDVAHDYDARQFDTVPIKQAVRRILREAGIQRGVISVAIVDDPTIHDINRRFLQHDYPTDVLSFVLERDAGLLEGELVVSADTAIAAAPRYGVQPEDELLLYVVHGALHLVGYDDLDPVARRQMRAAEARVLAELGVAVRHDDEESAGNGHA